MRSARSATFALVLAAVAWAEEPNKSRRLQAADCADLDGDGAVNVTGAHVSLSAADSEMPHVDDAGGP